MANFRTSSHSYRFMGLRGFTPKQQWLHAVANIPPYLEPNKVHVVRLLSFNRAPEPQRSPNPMLLGSTPPHFPPPKYGPNRPKQLLIGPSLGSMLGVLRSHSISLIAKTLNTESLNTEPQTLWVSTFCLVADVNLDPCASFVQNLVAPGKLRTL